MQEDELDTAGTEAEFGARVKEARKQKQWTQKKLADLIGIDASAISRIEQGVRAIRLGEAAHIARALGSDLDELVFGGELPPEVQLQRRRDSANRTMNQMRYAAVEMADSYIDIADLLTANDDLFSMLNPGDEDDERRLPRTVPEYFKWVERRTRALFQPDAAIQSYTPDTEVAASIQGLIYLIVENVVRTKPYSEADEDADEPET